MTARRNTVELQPEDDAYVARKVELGAFRSAEEAVSAGIQALREREERLERLIREEVLPAHDRLLAHPETGRTSDQVMSGIRENHRRLTGGR
jgi:putative addiction module CopG family antidote